MNLYEELELTQSCTKDEIKKSYRRLAMIHHPDKGGNEEKFKKISQAYETLYDDNKRREYDNPVSKNWQNGFNGMDDILKSFGRGFPFFEFNSAQRQNPNKIHIQQNIDLSLKEAYNGCTKDISITFTKNCSCYTDCKYCKGQGKIQQMFRQGPFVQMIEKICQACIGKGYSVKSDCEECDEIGKYEKTVQFKITFHPKTIYEKITIPLRENKNGKDKQIGDVSLNIKIKVETPFEIKDNHLIYNTDIDFVDTLCGKDITIPHPEKDITINTYDEFGIINPGPGNSQYKYKIKDFGFKYDGMNPKAEDKNSLSLGFLVINFKINYNNLSSESFNKNSRSLTKEQREKLRELLTSICSSS